MDVPDNIDRVRDERPSEDAAKMAWLERSVLVLLFLGLLIAVLEVLRPFTIALLFGAALASATWPLRQGLVHRGFGRGAAAAILLLLSVAVVVVPMLIVAPHLSDQIVQAVQQVKGYFAAAPEAPTWLSGLPLVGRRLATVWVRIVEAEGNFVALLEPYGGNIEEIVVTVAKGIADSVVQLILSLGVATLFWADGEVLVGVLHASLKRLGGNVADQVVDVAGGAICGVAYGVVGTAAVQAVAMAIGLAIAGAPGATMLGFVTFLLSISQIGGPLLVLIWGGAAWWLIGQDHQVWGIFMIVWGLCVSLVDTFIKPLFIGARITMPLALTVLGVFGGFIAFGFLGLFIGPTVIAVAFHLLQAWRTAAQST
jgi:predicted PurR-regulated permease PerM